MSWQLYRWTWLLEAPLHIGSAPAGSLNRCRLYVPARAVWGAVTAELATRKEQGLPDYKGVGQALQDGARFTYLFPAERAGEQWRAWLPRYGVGHGLVWRREDRGDAAHDIPEREMRMRLLGTRPATAIDPSSDVAAEGSLRETECVNICWRDESGKAGAPLAFAGYVAQRGDGSQPTELEAVMVGGDTRYGLGRMRRVAVEPASKVFGRSVQLDDNDPLVKSDVVFAHADAADTRLSGEQEAIGGWDYGASGVQRIAGAVWTPGSLTETTEGWIIEPGGLWRRQRAG